jgi:hypothetical protein
MSRLPISRADAAAFGLKRYYTGKRCQNGHDAERRTSSGRCVECERAQQRRAPKKRVPLSWRLSAGGKIE